MDTCHSYATGYYDDDYSQSPLQDGK